MFVDLTSDQKALREEIRGYFRNLISPEVLSELQLEQRESEAGPRYRQIVRQMGADGWLAVGWPKEYGGRGYTALEQLIFQEEAQRAGAPYPFVTLNTVGPALMTYGSDMQRSRFLPDIARGEILFAIGYTEPGAGTDLASLKLSAVLDGDSFVINGNKVYTTQADGADFIWLACRTNTETPKHKGISILIVDTAMPGYSTAPIHTVGGARTNISYYDNMRVPADMLVGDIDGGWRLITSQLNHERVGLASRGAIGEALLERTLKWAREKDGLGRRPIDSPTVQRLLAEVYSRLEGSRLMSYRLAADLSNPGASPDAAFASAAKVHGSETMIEVCRGLLEVLGTSGLVRRGSPAARLAGDVEEYYRKCQINTFGGGTAEVLREIVAQFGLHMPRTAR